LLSFSLCPAVRWQEIRGCAGLAVFEWHFKIFSPDNCRVFGIGIVGGGYFPACRKSVSFSAVITVTKKAITVNH
jgi:hypothetical protein